jgi:hypothetical protein
MMPRLSISLLAFVAGAAMVALPAAAQSVDFGDDTSIWAMDGECDDPRFVGEGMSDDPQEADILADASDCAAAFDAGKVTLDPAMADAQVPADRPAKPGTSVASAPGGIDFGADTSPWAGDGECDDPRFEGEGMAPSPQDADMFGDATDCQALFDAGSIQFVGGAPDVTPGIAGEVDFGADSGQWVNNGECDDPRFEGEGMAGVLLDEDLFADATDCRALYEAGMIEFVGEAADVAQTGDAGDAGAVADQGGEVDFGTDSSRWINDGECDDPRFEGEGMSGVLLDEDLFADATDCRALYEAGMIQLVGQATGPAGIDFGSDGGKWSNDGECDDPRFNGEGMGELLLDDFRFLDASDCRNLLEAGRVIYLGD